MSETQRDDDPRERFGALVHEAVRQSSRHAGARVATRPSVATRRQRAIGLGVALGCALAIGALALELSNDRPGNAVSGVSGAEREATVRSTQAPARLAAGTAPVSPIRWIDRQLRIDVERMPLDELGKELATVTGTVLTGAEALPSARRVTLHGGFNDIATAWHRLLDGEVLYLVDCSDADACRVLITRSVPAHSEGATQGGSNLPALDTLAPAPTPTRQLPGEAESQPDGAC